MSESNRGGRPPLAESERKSGFVRFRSKGKLVAYLEKAAELSGRSLSAEAEYRLLASFERPGLSSQLIELVNEQIQRDL